MGGREPRGFYFLWTSRTPPGYKSAANFAPSNYNYTPELNFTSICVLLNGGNLQLPVLVYEYIVVHWQTRRYLYDYSAKLYLPTSVSYKNLKKKLPIVTLKHTRTSTNVVLAHSYFARLSTSLLNYNFFRSQSSRSRTCHD